MRGAVCRRVGGGVDTEEKRGIISTVGTCQHLVVVGGDYCYYSLDYYLDPMGQHFDNDDFGGDCRVDKVFVVLVVVDFDFGFDCDTLMVVVVVGHNHKLVSAAGGVDCYHVGLHCCDNGGMWIALGLHFDQFWVEMG